MFKTSVPTVGSHQYGPVGSSEKLQRDIAKRVAMVLTMNHGASLEEIGFLGSTVLADRSGKYISVKLIFDPRLATSTRKNPHTREVVHVLHPALNNLANYFFVGDVSSQYVADYEECVVPKHSIDEKRVEVVNPETGASETVTRKVLEFRYDDNGEIKKTMEMQCLVINCNPALAFACVVDADLNDPEYSFSADTVKRQAKASDKTPRAGDIKNLLPASITITRSLDRSGYDPKDAIPYLKELHVEKADAEKKKRDAQRRAHDDADKNPKKVKSAKSTAALKGNQYQKFMNL